MMLHELYSLLCRKVRSLSPVEWTSALLPAQHPSFPSCHYRNLLFLGELALLFHVVPQLLQFRVPFCSLGWKTDTLGTDNPWPIHCTRDGEHSTRETENSLPVGASIFLEIQVTPLEPRFPLFLKGPEGSKSEF